MISAVDKGHGVTSYKRSRAASPWAGESGSPRLIAAGQKSKVNVGGCRYLTLDRTMGECQLCLGTRSSAPERRAGGRVNGLAEMLSQRLLPLAANRDYRPNGASGLEPSAPRGGKTSPDTKACTSASVQPSRHAAGRCE
jgi:hypothetical protein